MNHNQQPGDGTHEDDAALSDFLASLMDYTPTIPDELVEHDLAKSGFQCPDVRLIRLVAVATQKFVAEVATDALQQLFHATDGGTIALDWLMSRDVSGGALLMDSSISKNDTTPIIIAFPGLTSDSESAYIKHLAFNTAKHGWNVVVSNHRGLGGVSIIVVKRCSYLLEVTKLQAHPKTRPQDFQSGELKLVHLWNASALQAYSPLHS